jgi:beta-N-acetylhexosaminidase
VNGEAACIFGCAGLTLTAEEAAFFRDVRPWGFILFKRNIDSPGQVRALTAALRETVGRSDAPILIDQEGGRVQRMGPPHWPKYPPGGTYGALKANDPLLRREIARMGARLIAHDLAEVGINVDCMPVLDVPAPDAHDIIGDRAYGDSVETVATLGRAVAEGLIAGGVLPVIKHMPGHGRALADSHKDLPMVDASLADLEARDFEPFRILSDMPMAMSAHVVFTAIDPDAPATQSKTVIRRIMRGSIGFDGLLMTDDLSMQALKGGFRRRAEASLAAGCDVVLHCNGDMSEMRAVAEGAGPLAGKARRRADAALGRLAARPEPVDIAAARARFEAALR